MAAITRSSARTRWPRVRWRSGSATSRTTGIASPAAATRYFGPTAWMARSAMGPAMRWLEPHSKARPAADGSGSVAACRDGGGGSCSATRASRGRGANAVSGGARRGTWRGTAPRGIRCAWGRGPAAFRTLGDPRRAGPPAAVSVRAEAPLAGVRSDRVAALGALWRFAPAVSGARAMLEVEHAVADRASVVAGIEEQHGTRRDPAFSAGASSEVNGFHQGAWTEWRGTSGPVRLAWREERWGERAWARGAVRVVV